MMKPAIECNISGRLPPDIPEKLSAID